MGEFIHLETHLGRKLLAGEKTIARKMKREFSKLPAKKQQSIILGLSKGTLIGTLGGFTALMFPPLGLLGFLVGTITGIAISTDLKVPKVKQRRSLRKMM